MLRLRGSISAVGLLLAALPGVCPAQLFQTDTGNTAATVEYLAGQVSVLRDSQAWALNIGAQVRPQQVILTGPDGYAKFKVSDGSTFEVFPNSRVTFRNTPGDWQDLLEMWLGRVKVHIQKLNGMPNHNRVRTPTAIISVRGTTFDVQMEERDTTLVSVDEGMVEVRHALKGGEPRLLNTNEWIRVYKNVPLAKKTVDKTNVIQAALRAAADAIYTAIYTNPGGGTAPMPPGGGGGNGGGLPGDHPGGKDNPPTPPAPTSGGGSSGGTSTPAPPGDAGPGAPPPPK